MTVSSVREKFRLAILPNASTLSKILRFGVIGSIGSLAGGVVDEVLYPLTHAMRGSILAVMFGTGIWFAVFGVGTAVSLLGGLSKYLRGTFSLRPSIRSGVSIGAPAGFAAGAIAEWLYQFDPNDPLRVLCWGLAGGLLGFGLSFGLPNLGRNRGVLAGFAGGLVGGALFVAMSGNMGEGLGRVLGLGIIGFAIGLALVLADSVFREAWLEISYGPKERKTVSLGREPVLITGTPGAGTVSILGGPIPGHKYWLEDSRIWLEAGGSRTAVGGGHTQNFGKIAIRVHAAGKATPAAMPVKDSGVPLHGAALWIGQRSMPVREGIQFTSTDIPGLPTHRPQKTVAQVTRHPQDPTKLGLQNLSTQAWTIRFNSGPPRVVEPGQTFRIESGVRIAFGSTEGEIR